MFNQTTETELPISRKYLESSEKFYLCDTGIRYAVL